MKNIQLLTFFMFAVHVFVNGQQTTKSKIQQSPVFSGVKWLKGEPVSEFKKGRMYAVEFSATWCAPCRKMIPHLTELANKHRDKLTVVSLYIWQNNQPGPSGDTSYYQNVKKFIHQVENRISYTVGLDNPAQSTATAWNMSPQVDGVPKACLVDGDGHIVWSGYPLALDSVVAQMHSGRADSSKIQNFEHKNAEFRAVLQKVAKLKKNSYDRALQRMDSLLLLYPENQLLYSEKYKLLAGSDDVQAGFWLKQILKSLSNILIGITLPLNL